MTKLRTQQEAFDALDTNLKMFKYIVPELKDNYEFNLEIVCRYPSLFRKCGYRKIRKFFIDALFKMSYISMLFNAYNLEKTMKYRRQFLSEKDIKCIESKAEECYECAKLYHSFYCKKLQRKDIAIAIPLYESQSIIILEELDNYDVMWEKVTQTNKYLETPEDTVRAKHMIKYMLENHCADIGILPSVLRSDLELISVANINVFCYDKSFNKKTLETLWGFCDVYGQYINYVSKMLYETDIIARTTNKMTVMHDIFIKFV